MTVNEVLEKVDQANTDWVNACQANKRVITPFVVELNPAVIPFDALLELRRQQRFDFELVRCKTCNTSLSFCRHVPNRYPTALEAQTIQREQEKVRTRLLAEEAEIQSASQDESTDAEVSDTSKRRKHGSLLQAVPEEFMDTLVERYTDGARVADLSAEFNIAPKSIYDLLKDRGVQRAKGEHLKGIKRTPRPRSTVMVTPEMVEQGKVRIADGEAMTELAKEFNVNPQEFSQALKDAGVEIRKGRRGSKSNGPSYPPVNLAQGSTVEKYYLEGNSVADTAAHLGLHPLAVTDYLRAKELLRARGAHLKGRAPVRARTTQILTPEMVTEITARVQKGDGVTAMAKEYNVNQVELSTTLKAAGVEIRRGRRAKS